MQTTNVAQWSKSHIAHTKITNISKFDEHNQTNLKNKYKI